MANISSTVTFGWERIVHTSTSKNKIDLAVFYRKTGDKEKKAKQRWLSLDVAYRLSERRPADVHLRAEGNREQVAESEKSLKIWRRGQSSNQRKRIRCSHDVDTGKISETDVRP